MGVGFCRRLRHHSGRVSRFPERALVA